LQVSAAVIAVSGWDSQSWLSGFSFPHAQAQSKHISHILISLKMTNSSSLEEVCLECGLRSAPGGENCASLRDLLLARDFEQPVLYWQYHRLAVDTYCVQHAPYVKSARSLAAHLCGLCIFFEHSNDQSKMTRLQHWLSTNPNLPKPELPTHRGSLTIAHVSGITDPAAYGQAVNGWALSAWQAYSPLQPLAREWLALSAAWRGSDR
jgi:Family of unknown function (DUF5946)